MSISHDSKRRLLELSVRTKCRPGEFIDRLLVSASARQDMLDLLDQEKRIDAYVRTHGRTEDITLMLPALRELRGAAFDRWMREVEGFYDGETSKAGNAESVP